MIQQTKIAIFLVYIISYFCILKVVFMKDFEEWDNPSIKEYTDLQKYAFITKKAIEHSYIGYCYREYSDIKIDSGWRFLYGDEDEVYLDNPDNSLTKDIAELLVFKPELDTIIAERPNSEFEWNEEKQVFEKI